MTFPRLRWIAMLFALLVNSGCCFRQCKLEFHDDGCYDDNLVAEYGAAGLRPEDPLIDECGYDAWFESLSPDDMPSMDELRYSDISLDDCIRLALQNSKVMRDLGGTILRSPNSLATAHDPALAYTDPRFGEEAALAAFDANLFASAFFEKNDRAFNNNFFGSNGFLVQDLGDYRWGVSKRAATGSVFTFRHITAYDFNNQLGNQFGSPSGSYDTYLEAEMRQPLLQGAGITFNRIAGPSTEPGVINGVLIARINTDINLAQFEQGVRDLVSNVENAYWDLYFAYRDLDAKIQARDNALETWQSVKVFEESGSKAGEKDKEGQAREQYFRFEAEVLDALHGRLVDGTRTNNGSSSGTFRSNGGVRVAERRLRLILGMPINGADLLRPADQPLEAPIRFDWHSAANEALAKRTELRQQKWRVKQRELELVANKNFLLPRTDLVGRYRFRGFGEALMGQGSYFDPNSPNTNSVAAQDLLSGRRQEWQLGVEVNVPIGYRREHAAVRNAEIQLARERARLREQEREVAFGLSNAIGELRRAFEAKSIQYNRLVAATDQRKAIEDAYKREVAPLDLKLEAERRVVDTMIRYYQAEVEYMLALKNVHFEKGTLLEYCDVRMAEDLWPSKAYDDARERDRLRGAEIDYTCRDLTIAKGDARSTRFNVDSAGHGLLGEGMMFDPNELQPTWEQPVIIDADTVAPGMTIEPTSTRYVEPTDLPTISSVSDAGDGVSYVQEVAKQKSSAYQYTDSFKVNTNTPATVQQAAAQPAVKNESSAATPSDQRQTRAMLDPTKFRTSVGADPGVAQAAISTAAQTVAQPAVSGSADQVRKSEHRFEMFPSITVSHEETETPVKVVEEAPVPQGRIVKFSDN